MATIINRSTFAVAFVTWAFIVAGYQNPALFIAFGIAFVAFVYSLVKK